MRISDWSSDVCSSDLVTGGIARTGLTAERARRRELHGLAGADRSGARVYLDRLQLRLEVRTLDAAVTAGGKDERGKHAQQTITFHRKALPDCCYGLCAKPLPHMRKIDEPRSEEHTSELQTLMRISYAVFC